MLFVLSCVFLTAYINVTVREKRSNQLNYVPTLFSYLYRKPACLVAFLRFNRFACLSPVSTS